MAFDESTEAIRGKMIDMAEQIRETGGHMKEACQAKEVARLASLSTHLAYLGSEMTRLTEKYNQVLDQHQEFNQSRSTISRILPIPLPYEPLTRNGQPQIQSRKRPGKGDNDKSKESAQARKRRIPQARNTQANQNTGTGPSTFPAPGAFSYPPPPSFPGPFTGAYPNSKPNTSTYPASGSTGSGANTGPGPSYFGPWASGFGSNIPHWSTEDMRNNTRAHHHDPKWSPFVPNGLPPFAYSAGQHWGTNFNGNTSTKMSGSAQTDNHYFNWEQAGEEEPLAGGSADSNNLFFTPNAANNPNGTKTTNDTTDFNFNRPYEPLRDYATERPWTNFGAQAPSFTTPKSNMTKPFWSGPTAVGSGDDCAICLDSLDDGLIESLACKHRFHTGCIGQWRTREQHCPICRRPL